MESSQPLEGVSIDTRLVGLSQEESTAWADDKLVIQWIMKFTDGGQEGNSFQRGLEVCQCMCGLVIELGIAWQVSWLDTYGHPAMKLAKQSQPSLLCAHPVHTQGLNMLNSELKRTGWILLLFTNQL